MSNFMDYLDWRGDLAFSEAPFNEVDALLLSYLSYVNLDGVLSDLSKESAPAIPLCKVRERFFSIHTQEEFKKDRSFIRQAPLLLDKMGSTRRFGQILLSHYVNHIDIGEEVQFSALKIDLPDMVYISFRGTDDTIIGWKEDFNISYLTVPAEQEAVKYVNRVLRANKKPVITGGHSKGAHLAVYAAAKVTPAIRDRILAAYNFDGPGFDEAFLASKEMQEIKGRVRRYVPEDSVIGMLLGHSVEPVIVKSSSKGMMQHDPFSWQLIGPSFTTCAHLGKMGTLMDDTFTTWIAQVDPAQRKVFIDDLFSVLEASGAKTLTELYNGNLKSYLAMLKRLDKLDDRTGKVLKLLVEAMFDQLAERLSAKKNMTALT